jgi:hypothetical protein
MSEHFLGQRMTCLRLDQSFGDLNIIRNQMQWIQSGKKGKDEEKA